MTEQELSKELQQDHRDTSEFKLTKALERTLGREMKSQIEQPWAQKQITRLSQLGEAIGHPYHTSSKEEKDALSMAVLFANATLEGDQVTSASWQNPEMPISQDPVARISQLVKYVDAHPSNQLKLDKRYMPHRRDIYPTAIAGFLASGDIATAVHLAAHPDTLIPEQALRDDETYDDFTMQAHEILAASLMIDGGVLAADIIHQIHQLDTEDQQKLGFATEINTLNNSDSQDPDMQDTALPTPSEAAPDAESPADGNPLQSVMVDQIISRINTDPGYLRDQIIGNGDAPGLQAADHLASHNQAAGGFVEPSPAYLDQNPEPRAQVQVFSLPLNGEDNHLLQYIQLLPDVNLNSEAYQSTALPDGSILHFQFVTVNGNQVLVSPRVEMSAQQAETVYKSAFEEIRQQQTEPAIAVPTSS